MGARRKVWLGLTGVAALGVAALAAAGDLDSTFGTGGIVQYAATGYWTVDCAVQPDGKVVVAAYDVSGTTRSWRIDRRLASGALDTTWGSGGTVTLHAATNGGAPSDVALDGSGLALVAGQTIVTVVGKGGRTSSSSQATVSRLSSSGAVEFTTSIAVPGSTASVAKGIAVDGSDRILVAGVASFIVRKTSNSATFVARLTPSGALDTSFGSNGITVNDVASGDESVNQESIGIQSDGRIVVSGTHSQVIGNESYRRWDITRYTADGAIDTAFGTVHGPGTYDSGQGGIVIDGSDRIVAAGARYSSLNVSDMLVVRFTANGALDTSFGSGGATTIHTTTRSESGYPSIDSSGRIVLLAWQVYVSGSTYTSDVVTARLDRYGALDTLYGTGGVTDAVGLGVRDEPRGLALTSGDDVVVVGDSYDSGNAATWFVARYLGD